MGSSFTARSLQTPTTATPACTGQGDAVRSDLPLGLAGIFIAIVVLTVFICQRRRRWTQSAGRQPLRLAGRSFRGCALVGTNLRDAEYRPETRAGAGGRRLREWTLLSAWSSASASASSTK